MLRKEEKTKREGGGNDAELIKKYLAGNAHTFDILYEKYKKQLYSYLKRMLSGRNDIIDDIFQKTWLKAIDKFGSYTESERFLAWIMRISHNLAVDHFRGHAKEQLDDFTGDRQEIFSTTDSPWKSLHRKELGKAIDECVSVLPDEQREVFALRTDDVAFKDIAEIQRASINTVLARMQYALKNLKNCLRKRGQHK